MNIAQDHDRFKKIVRGRIRADLRKFMTRGEYIGKEGKHIVSIPVDGIHLPRFRYGDNNDSGMGTGDAQKGDPADGGEQTGPGGTDPGKHILEVEVSLDELADILGEELQLPRIEPKGKKLITDEKLRYSGIRPTGPESLRHFKRTYRRAMIRQIMLGEYDPKNPRIIFERHDKIFRSWKTVRQPQSNAVIFYMMDVSGSMGNEQKELVRIEAFWIDAWLRRNFQDIENRYIVHDIRAHLVDRHTFYHLREDGGTKISSAFQMAKELIEHQFNPMDWNIYIFHFSDGDNSSGSDNSETCRIIRENLLPVVNMVGYSQVTSSYGSGDFLNVLTSEFGNEEKVVTTKVNNREEVYDAIKTLFGKGL